MDASKYLPEGSSEGIERAAENLKPILPDFADSSDFSLRNTPAMSI